MFEKFCRRFGSWFSTNLEKTKEERDKGVTKNFKCTDSKARAAIKSTLDNYMDKIKQDPDIMTDMTRLREEHGNKKRFKLLYKCNKISTSLQISTTLSI